MMGIDGEFSRVMCMIRQHKATEAKMASRTGPTLVSLKDKHSKVFETLIYDRERISKLRARRKKRRFKKAEKKFQRYKAMLVAMDQLTETRSNIDIECLAHSVPHEQAAHFPYDIRLIPKAYRHRSADSY